MGSEFVAARVWREVDAPQLASRLPELNSFVPNLVWLPSQVAKLSDIEGSPLQRTLQSMSWAVYRGAPVAEHLRSLVEESWRLIPEPDPVHVEHSDLNWFVATDAFLQMRQKRLNEVVDALKLLCGGAALTKKVIATRYTEGLPQVSSEALGALLGRLERFSPTVSNSG